MNWRGYLPKFQYANSDQDFDAHPDMTWRYHTFTLTVGRYTVHLEFVQDAK